MTGAIGVYGTGVLICGELTVWSFQWVLLAMIVFTDFGLESRFIDVRCGLGKPKMHAVQYHGVTFKLGVEVQQIRWILGLGSQQGFLKKVKAQKIGQVKDSNLELVSVCLILGKHDINFHS